MHSILFPNSQKTYGDQYKAHYLEQYKMYLDGIEKISDRRHSANSFFLTLNTLLITVIGLTFQIDSLNNTFWLRIALSIIGILVNIIFYLLIKSYKQLNTGKFKVLHEIEKNLPLSLYKYEWEVLGSGKDKKKYWPFSHIEICIPQILGALYLALGLTLMFIELFC